jgi:hypothetical protein
LQPWASCFTSIALVLRMRRTWCLCQWQAKYPIQACDGLLLPGRRRSH